MLTLEKILNLSLNIHQLIQNKALHIGHLRNVVIGDAVSRILSKANYDVKVLNYVDDSGLQVADIIVGFKHGGFSEDPPDGEKFANYCGDTCLLYTSPSPRDRQKSRMPSSA